MGWELVLDYVLREGQWLINFMKTGLKLLEELGVSHYFTFEYLTVMRYFFVGIKKRGK